MVLPTLSAPGSAFPYTVTLACVTPGNSIYYSLDGSLPTSKSGASLYSAPFSVPGPGPVTVRAAAEAPGYQASNCIVGTLG